MDLPTLPLRSSSQILHLLHHRNKNQHRRAHWFQYLSLLKRHLNKLIAEVETPDPVRANARVLYMIEHLLPRCYV